MPEENWLGSNPRGSEKHCSARLAAVQPHYFQVSPELCSSLLSQERTQCRNAQQDIISNPFLYISLNNSSVPAVVILLCHWSWEPGWAVSNRGGQPKGWGHRYTTQGQEPQCLTRISSHVEGRKGLSPVQLGNVRWYCPWLVLAQSCGTCILSSSKDKVSQLCNHAFSHLTFHLQEHRAVRNLSSMFKKLHSWVGIDSVWCHVIAGKGNL